MGHDVVYPVSVRIASIDIYLLPLVLLFATLGPTLFVYIISRAVLCGLASARDPEHRVAPQSPWYFFDPHWRKALKPAILAYVIGGIAPLALLNLLQVILIRMSVLGFPWVVSVAIFELGWIFATLSIVLFLAPKLSSPLALATIGLLFGLLTSLIFLAGSILVLFMERNYSLGGKAFPEWLYPILIPCPVLFVTSLTLAAIWRELRKEPTFEWFRFKD